MKYEYVSISNSFGLLSTKFKGHQEIINQYAEKGYRYVGYIPTEFAGHGQVITIDLIFEKI